MYHLKNREIRASEIAEYLNRPLQGEDVLITSPNSICLSEGTVRSAPPAGGASGCLVLADSGEGQEGSGALIVVERPRLQLARVLMEFFASPLPHGVDPSAHVSPRATLGQRVHVGANAVIGPGVSVGDDSIIMDNAIIHGPATIGSGCVIKCGAIVGSEGYGFVTDETGRLIHMPQLGAVLVGDGAWIGANSTVERAMSADTVIEAEVKVDDLVHIGGGSVVGKGSLVTSGCILENSVRLGERVRLLPNAVVRSSVVIVDEAIVGEGAVVTTSIAAKGVYYGVPARLRQEKG